MSAGVAAGMLPSALNGDALTLPAVVGAALADSINPCAFAVLLTFIATTLAIAERTSVYGAQARWLLWRTGLVFVFGVFLTYLGLGLGLLSFARALGQTHWVGRAAALGAIGLGILVLQEALVPEWGVRLAAPSGLRTRLHALGGGGGGRVALPAVFGAGILVGLCTVPCSGAIYLAVLGLLAVRTTWLTGFAYLLLYNALFVLPLLGLLGAAGSRPVFNQLGRWQLHHRDALKLGIGVLAVSLGLTLLATL